MVNEEEFVSMMQGMLGRARGDLIVASRAMTGESSTRLLAAAELIEKTQSELSAVAAEHQRARAIPPLPVPGPGRG